MAAKENEPRVLPAGKVRIKHKAHPKQEPAIVNRGAYLAPGGFKSKGWEEVK